MMINKKPLLLIIDDEQEIRLTLKEALEDEGYRVEVLENACRALEVVGEMVPDLILLDVLMPEVNGIDLLVAIKREYPQQQVMIISGFGNIPLALEAVKKGALDFLEKPLCLDTILAKIAFLHQDNKFMLQASQDFKDYSDYGIVGKSYLFCELMNQVDILVDLRTPLLIYGQPGTGKSLVASYVHNKKSAEIPLLVINCVSRNSLDILKKIDSPCTLYLKNINYLLSDDQREFAAFIESGATSNCRIIASSTQQLYTLVQRGLFSQLLFYQLNVTPIEIPPLHKRAYDIPLLIHHFVDQLGFSGQIIFSSSSVRLLRNHVWQSNVAGLKAFIHNIATYYAGEQIVITPDHMDLFFEEKNRFFIEEQSFTSFRSFKDATAAFEKNFLLYLLKKNRYDLNQVSERLCLNMTQLRDKMLELNIDTQGQSPTSHQ